jgi:hypothetical protein
MTPRVHVTGREAARFVWQFIDMLLTDKKAYIDFCTAYDATVGDIKQSVFLRELQDYRDAAEELMTDEPAAVWVTQSKYSEAEVEAVLAGLEASIAQIREWLTGIVVASQELGNVEKTGRVFCSSGSSVAGSGSDGVVKQGSN